MCVDKGWFSKIGFENLSRQFHSSPNNSDGQKHTLLLSSFKNWLKISKNRLWYSISDKKKNSVHLLSFPKCCFRRWILKIEHLNFFIFINWKQDNFLLISYLNGLVNNNSEIGRRLLESSYKCKQFALKQNK